MPNDNTGASPVASNTTLKDWAALIGSLTALVVAFTGLVKACDAQDSAKSATDTAEQAKTNAQTASSAAASVATKTEELNKAVQPIASAVVELQAKHGPGYLPQCPAGKQAKGISHCAGKPDDSATRLCGEVLRQKRTTQETLTGGVPGGGPSVLGGLQPRREVQSCRLLVPMIWHTRSLMFSPASSSQREDAHSVSALAHLVGPTPATHV